MHPSARLMRSPRLSNMAIPCASALESLLLPGERGTVVFWYRDRFVCALEKWRELTTQISRGFPATGQCQVYIVILRCVVSDDGTDIRSQPINMMSSQLLCRVLRLPTFCPGNVWRRCTGMGSRRGDLETSVSGSWTRPHYFTRACRSLNLKPCAVLPSRQLLVDLQVCALCASARLDWDLHLTLTLLQTGD